MPPILDLLETDETIQSSTNYSVGQIWDKRPWLSGSANYLHNPDVMVTLEDKSRSVGAVIENTGVDSPAVEVRPQAKVIETKRMPHVYHTHVTSAHDFNDLVKRYNAAGMGGADKALEELKKWALECYDPIVDKYVAACERGLCQQISNINGWVVKGGANQEPFSHKPVLGSSTTGAMADFGTTEPGLKLLNDVVLQSQSAGINPNVVLIGDDVAQAIMQSAYYSTGNRTTPRAISFSYTPAESSSTVRANGALELEGVNAGGCLVVWINSKTNGVANFEPNSAVALNMNQFATIYSGVTYADLGLHNDIIRFAPGPRINEKEIRYFYEYSYMPALNAPSQVFRIIYS